MGRKRGQRELKQLSQGDVREGGAKVPRVSLTLLYLQGQGMHRRVLTLLHLRGGLKGGHKM